MRDADRTIRADHQSAIAYWGNDNPPIELVTAFSAHRGEIIRLVCDWLVGARFMCVTADEIALRFGLSGKGVRVLTQPQEPIDPVEIIAGALRDGSPFQEDGAHDYRSEANVIAAALAARGLEIREMGQ